jgi:type IX secretion system PorP/SprF family membrane protein
MKALIKISLVLVTALGSMTAYAQQDPMYTHYMYNTISVNPAYAGSRDALTLTALHRSQWVGFSGAPLTQTFSMHAPLKNHPVGLGFSVMNDKIGPTNNTAIYADFAYIMRLTEKSKLALGLSGGVNIFQANLMSRDLDQPGDAVFQTNVSNHVTPNFGFGIYYSRERFYAGISAPFLLQNSYNVSNSHGDALVAKEQRHYFFIAGTMLKISDNLAFKPTTLVKVTAGAPVQADVTASFIIAKRLLLGAMFRTGDAFGALVGFDITDQFHVGYSFDWSYGLSTGKYNNGSHEIVLRYDFLLFGKKQIHSPRYF